MKVSVIGLGFVGSAMFESYKPSPLGDKIYVYRGINGGKDNYYGWNDIATILSETFGSSSIH